MYISFYIFTNLRISKIILKNVEVIITMNKDLLFTDYLKALIVLCDNRVTIKNEMYCVLTQEEIAGELGVTRITASNMLKKLKENGFITFDNPRRYKIENDALELVKQIKEIYK